MFSKVGQLEARGNEVKTGTTAKIFNTGTKMQYKYPINSY